MAQPKSKFGGVPVERKYRFTTDGGTYEVTTEEPAAAADVPGPPGWTRISEVKS
jgi:hypothetical protein